jgi:hypothetical protein
MPGNMRSDRRSRKNRSLWLPAQEWGIFLVWVPPTINCEELDSHYGLNIVREEAQPHSGSGVLIGGRRLSGVKHRVGATKGLTCNFISHDRAVCSRFLACSSALLLAGNFKKQAAGSRTRAKIAYIALLTRLVRF